MQILIQTSVFFVLLFCVIPVISLPTVLESDDYVESFAKEERGIADDKSPFDKIAEINTKNDLSGLYEGDIRLAPDITKKSDVIGGEDGMKKLISEKRNAVNFKEALWPGKVVPYKIGDSVSTWEGLIKMAMSDISQSTCITFKPYSNERNYVEFFKGSGCYSPLGRYYYAPGANRISLGDGCNRKGIIIHEILHTLGVWHEQSRMDRDKNIEIFWENIKEGYDGQFDKNSRQHTLVDYDYDSIMHYGAYAFSSNGKKTIVPINNPTASIGQRDGLSPKDITELNVLYDCQSQSTDFYSTWGSWLPCSSTCYKKRQRFCSHEDLTKCPKVNIYGVEDQYLKCTDAECYAPIDGHWGRWSDWTACSKTCGIGQTTRTRQCNDPAPKNGGKLCDGYSWAVTNCKTSACNLGPDDCEFSDGKLCGWTNRTDDQLDWTVKTGPTPSGGTGPSGDHTSLSGTGYYAYVEASVPADYLNRAVLQSKVMQPSSSGKKCLSFWYHMYGGGMGKLNVLFKDATSGAISTLKTISGNQGNQWMEQYLQITTTSSFQILFEAVIGTSYESDIAIDDVYFKDGKCFGALGMEDRRIADYQISSSSDYDHNHRAYFARLNQNTRWCANWNKRDTKQFLRVDFDKRHLISAVAVQGQSTWDNWVLTYKINYTEDGYTIKTIKENGVDKIFKGPTDRNTAVKQTFAVAIKTFAIIINPQTYHGNDICMRIELYGKVDSTQPAIPEGCSNHVRPLGMASRLIKDTQITASSIWDSNHQGYQGRLNNYKVWCVKSNKNNLYQYIQVDFGKVMLIEGIATQGHPTYNNYVKSFQIEYSYDGTQFFTMLVNQNQIFSMLRLPANRDQSTIVKHKLPRLLKTRYIRINPKEYFGNDICLRAEFYGCDPI